MKQFKKILMALAITGTLAVGLSSCKSGPKDADLKNQAQAALPEGITVDVKKGVATLTGEYNDDLSKQKAEDALKAIPGIKSVEDQATVKKVEISADEELATKVNEALKNYTGVTAEVQEGVVTLNGEFKRDDLAKLMQEIQSLKPKKVENKLTLK